MLLWHQAPPASGPLHLWLSGHSLSSHTFPTRFCASLTGLFKCGLLSGGFLILRSGTYSSLTNDNFCSRPVFVIKGGFEGHLFPVSVTQPQEDVSGQLAQFSSVAQLCLTLCDLVDYRMPRFSIHYRHSEHAHSFTFIKRLFSSSLLSAMSVVICISEVIDISPSYLDSSLCVI